MKLIFLGPPGAGKGTQALGVSSSLNIPHISTGDMIRKEIADGSELGKMAAEIINNGQLLSDDIVIKMIESRIKSEASDVFGFIFDGFPRTVAQAEALTTYGILGIKVWICKGEVYGKRELVPNSLLQTKESRPGNANANGKRGGFRKKKTGNK